jgi:hypothetical protein
MPALPFWSKTLVITAICVLIGACGSDDEDTPVVEATPTTLSLAKVGGFQHSGGAGSAEITAFDPSSKRLFVVNGALGTVDVLDLSNPASPTLLGQITLGAGEGVNSVAVRNGVVALAVQAAVKTDPGRVLLYSAAVSFATTPAPIASVTVGALPDMLVFSPDGKTLLVANEGEPNSYNQLESADPEGSISLIDVSAVTASSTAVSLTARTAGFSSFNTQLAALQTAGVRIYGPNATVAQDLEPEYITVSADSSTAYVTLQENNAVAIVNIATATVTDIKALGTKDHSLAGYGMDASDEDGGTDTNSGTAAIKISTVPVKGLYLPDAIASYSVGGSTYLITANEGDARADWPGFNEETRVRAYCSAGLDSTVFGASAAALLFDSNLGRLRITSAPNGNSTGKNIAGECNELYAFGGRSFSIWTTGLSRVYDSGDSIEQRTSTLDASIANFNASHDNNTLDGRSANKGPEPEGVVVGQFGSKHYAFIGLERVGGVMVYDVTTPSAPTYVTYLNTRTTTTGDLGPEGLALVKASDSPNGKPLLIVGHEVSGTTAVYQLNLSY